MGGAGVGVVEGAAGAVEEDDGRSCAVLAIGYCFFAHLVSSTDISCSDQQSKQHSVNCSAAI